MESAFWLVAVEAQGRWLLHRPAGRGLLPGLWRWPAVPLIATAQDLAAEDAAPYTALPITAWPGWTQIYTHRREVVNPVKVRLGRATSPPPDMAWVDLAELDLLPMGRRDLRLKALALGGRTDHTPAPTALAAGLAKLLNPAC